MGPDSGPPPGWYADPQTGYPRWWDGASWGPWAPMPPPRPAPDSSWAIVTHLGSFFGGFILPLVIYVTVGERDPFIRHHAREALNFQLTLIIVAFITMAITFPLFFASVISLEDLDTGAVPPMGFFAFFPLMFIPTLVGWVFAIVAAVAAHRRRWWRYPISIRFVGRAEARAEEVARAVSS